MKPGLEFSNGEEGSERWISNPELKRKGKENGKMAAFAHGALHLNPSPVGLDNGSSDGQAQSRPLSPWARAAAVR